MNRDGKGREEGKRKRKEERKAENRTVGGKETGWGERRMGKGRRDGRQAIVD